jgi:hypothetical protein
MKVRIVLILHVILLFGGMSALAQSPNRPSTVTETTTQDEAQIVNYPASFFDRYQPNTALEIVTQIPGFIINDGDRARGFGERVDLAVPSVIFLSMIVVQVPSRTHLHRS